MMNLQIKGTGSALAKEVFTNEQLSQIVETNDAWIKERTGITKRHLSTGETVSSLAALACQKALKKAQKNAQEVQLIIVATCSPELALPCSACQVQDAIGAVGAVCFDLNAACAGFLFALNTAYAYFAAGIYKNALIVGAEVLSKIVDWEDRTTCILFGDGAGAAYVEADWADENHFHFVQYANGSKKTALTCAQWELRNPLYPKKEMGNEICLSEFTEPADEQGVSLNPWEQTLKKSVCMNGKEIFQFALRQIPDCIEEVLKKAGLQKEDIDYYVLHQANLRIVEGIAKRLKEDLQKFPTNVENVGNMSSASIPVLLDECFEKGIFQSGQTIVLSGFGAGLTYGACVIRL